MRNINIVIEGMELELTDAELQLKYVFSDLTNVANITTDFSTNFKVKGTKLNNEIFGQIYEMDRYIVSGNTNVGYNFNPSKRANTIIYLNGQILKKGYTKLDSITIEQGIVIYNLVFYSEVAKILRRLKEFKLADCGQLSITPHHPDRQYILSDWSGTSVNFNTLRYIPSYQGTYPNFTSNQWFTENNEFGSVIGDLDVDEAMTNEYRAVYQMPALKVNSTINAIVSEWNDFNDEQIRLGSWFNSGNTYFNDSVFTIGNLSSEKKEIDISDSASTMYINSNGDINDTSFAFEQMDGFSTDFFKLSDKMSYCNLDNYSGTYKWTNINGRWFVRNDYQGTIEVGEDIEVNINYDESIHSVSHFNIPQANAIWTSGGTSSYYTDKATPSINNVYLHIDSIVATTSEGTIITGHILQDIDCEIVHTKSINSKSISSFSMSYPKCLRLWSNNTPRAGAICIFSSGVTSEIRYINVSASTEQQITTGSLVSKSDLIDSELKQGDILIDYCKLFGLLFEFDNNNNLYIRDKKEYFRGGRILDWTDKVDYSSTLEEQPLPFDNRYYTIGYTPNDTFYEKHYSDKFDANYGEAKIDTGYEFAGDDKSEEIYDSMFTTTICSRESGRYVVNGAIRNYANDKVLPALFEKSSNVRTNTSTKYSLLFDNGIKTPSKDMYVTDDIAQMWSDDIDNAARCWIDCAKPSVRSATSAVTKAEIYRQYTTLKGDCSFDIGYPMENYAGYTTTTYPSGNTIYNKYWNRYISDIYNVNNKVLKCKVWLSDIDILSFSFKNFVKIDNCIYHINEIEFVPTSNEPTSVTLIRVKDMGAYTNAPVYSISYSLENARCSSNLTKISEGSSFSATITKNAGFNFDELYVSMGGVFVSSGDTNIYISAVTGNIEIVARAEAYTSTIFYTSTNNQIVEPTSASSFDCPILENYYDEANESGYLVFDGKLTQVGEKAFAYCRTLSSVQLPDSVTTLGNGAFGQCTYLNSVTLSSGLTSIAKEGFVNCSRLTSINIPNGVTRIGSFAFKYCNRLTSINLPSSCRSIGKDAFRNCSRLASINLENVNTIGNYAFVNCDSLRSVDLSNATSIGEFAFWGGSGTSLETVVCGCENIPTQCFGCCSALTSVTLFNTKTIGYRTFQECSSLTEIEFPEGLTTIGQCAFIRCTLLESVSFPSTLAEIQTSAFEWCFSLTEPVLPESITAIGNGVFVGDDSLGSIKILATTPPTIGTNVMDGTDESLIYVPDRDEYDSPEGYAKGWYPYIDLLHNIEE